MSDDLSLTVGGQVLAGWTEVSVTLSMEQIPNSFRILATDRSPVSGQAAMVQEGAPCVVKLGADTVITGYVDAVLPGYDASSHTVSIEGRGKCQDLADCSAEWKGSVVASTNALDIASKLAAPYGVTAKNLGPKGPDVPQFVINIGDTPIDVLEKVTRYAGLVYYEDSDGNLVLNQAGSAKAASGFTEGQNVQIASYLRSMNGRYSDYWVAYMPVYTGPVYADLPGPGTFVSMEKDPNVKRNRKLFLVAEEVVGNDVLARKRVLWEMARRAGRSRTVTLRCDSWRDAAGKLWTPNTLAQVVLPRLQLPGEQLCISTVTFSIAERTGKTADLVLMPKEAFLPQPIVLQPPIPGVDGFNPETPAAPARPQPGSGQ